MFPAKYTQMLFMPFGWDALTPGSKSLLFGDPSGDIDILTYV